MIHGKRYMAMALASVIALSGCQKKGGAKVSTSEDADSTVQTANDSLLLDTLQQRDAETPVEQANARVMHVDGVALGGAMNSIIVEDVNGTAHDFEFSELSRDSIDPWEEGDLVRITYSEAPHGGAKVKAIRKLEQ